MLIRGNAEVRRSQVHFRAGPGRRCFCLRLLNRRPETLGGYCGTKAEVLHMGCRHEQRELCPARSLWAHPAHSFYPQQQQQQQSGFPTDHFQPTIVRESLALKDIELGER
ncbi:hypothetical protein KC365_g144 [Hortaea werneckii]|nr:hypothetical protein KC339_g141 [Hortaea werneckii]KAI7245898.1 hypothetical protein KC365_g144 [Hortaea werneckii]